MTTNFFACFTPTSRNAPALVFCAVALLLASLAGCGGDNSSDTNFAISQDTLEVTAVAEGLAQPNGIGVDLDSIAFKDFVFVAEFGKGQVSAISPVGVVTPIATTGLSGPTGILIDILADALFVTESQINEVTRVDFGGAQAVTTVIAALPQGVFPVSIGSDGRFRYVGARNTTQLNDDRIYNISTNSPTLVASGFSKINTILFRQQRDEQVELLVADTKDNTIYLLKIEEGRTEPITTFRPLVENLESPTGMAVGPASEYLYISETGANRVVRVKPDGSGDPEVVAKINTPVGLLFDQNGKLFVTSSGEGRLFRISGLPETVN